MFSAQRLLSPIVAVRQDEAKALLLMFLYSFLVMTSYNIIKPLTRAQFIQELGAGNLPWVLLASGVLVGGLMQLYTKGVARLPAQSVLTTTQLAVGGMLVGFWVLFRGGVPGTSVAFYVVGQVLGLLLISQFWTLANDIYDARQAKRLFGFVGGGASLGGIAGSAILAFSVGSVGANNLLLVSSVLLVACAGVVTSVIRHTAASTPRAAAAPSEAPRVVSRPAVGMLRESPHLRCIAMVIGLAAIGAGLLDQQLNMAVEEAAGAGGDDRVAAFLGQVQLYLSIAGLVIQVGLTSTIQRRLGVGFALVMLPVSLGLSAGLILATGALTAAAAGRILDASLRYTVDKTSREILFLPLPAELKRQAKPFLDVTVDRVAKGIGAALTLILIQPWGLGLSWPQLSWVSLVVMAVWVASAMGAYRQYLVSFRESIAHQGLQPTTLRAQVADLSTLETLVEELGHPDAPRVLYAIDILESLDKQNLVTPLLLHHTSTDVRVRALGAVGAARADIAGRWKPAIEQLVKDPRPQVRAAAFGALAKIHNQDATVIARTLIDDADTDPHVLVTAAVVLSTSRDESDVRSADSVLATLATDTRRSTVEIRRDLATVIRQLGSRHTRDLLIPLLHDTDATVADEAMRSVRALETTDSLFAPTLVSLLANRRLKSSARETIVHYGEPILDLLEHVLGDTAEDIAVRRHIPATMALIPCQRSMDDLVSALERPEIATDGLLRFKVLSAIEKLNRDHPSLTFASDPVERVTRTEGRDFFKRLVCHYNLFTRGALPNDSILARVLDEKTQRSIDRMYRLLGLLYPWKDIAATRWAIEHGDSRARAGALEYLDNMLPNDLRRYVLPVLEDLPLEEKVARGNALLRDRVRDVEETLLGLIHDEDQVVAAAAIFVVGVHKLWNLRDDVEYVRTHRDVSDRYVCETASWTLAAHAAAVRRQPDRWVGELPVAAAVDRLRRLPLFTGVGVDDLFRLTETGHQIRHEPGTTLFREGMSPEQLHVLLEGEVAVSSRRRDSQRITSPATLGFDEALDSCLMMDTIHATKAAVTFSLSRDDLKTLLADNVDLLQGFFRTVATRNGARRGLVTGHVSPSFAQFDALELTPLQKGQALRHVVPFAELSGVEMLHLASITQHVRIEADATFSDETGLRPGIALLLSGTLRLSTARKDHTVWRAAAGDVLGLYETLAGFDTRLEQMRLVAAEPCSVLYIERDDLFDLLGQRSDLLQQLFVATFDGGTPAPFARARTIA